MSFGAKGWILLVVHLLLVGSIAGKYAWERHSCPRVWTRASQYDPNQPLRGRYLALTLHADACGLTDGRNANQYGWNAAHQWGSVPGEEWNVAPVARDGKLTARVVSKDDPNVQTLAARRDQPCSYATLNEPVEFFVTEHANTPTFPLPYSQELWAEVTVPPSGPPRPIRLAVSDGKNFRVLDLH